VSDLLRTPRIAWPTLAVFAGAFAVWVASAASLAAGAAPAWLSLLLSTAAAFAIFTPLHDAAHRSLGDSRLLSEGVGRVAALVLAAPFPAFRFVHLEHHRHTNDPLADPDYWSGRPPAWSRPLRWLTQDWHYYAFIFAARRSRPRGELAEVGIWLLLQLTGIGTALVAGHAAWLFLAWLLPARLALGLLAFAFDYLPHVPHAVLARDDPYRATLIRSNAWLTPLFLYQNYHLVHHLYPGVPFYRYAHVWYRQRQQLEARGARDARLFAG
jgi:beta-carotene hydroxylase